MALYTGPMQCFCIAEKKDGKKKTEYYTLKDKRGGISFQGQICLEYSNDQLKSKLYGLSITVIIVVINQILKKGIIDMVSWIGIDTLSKQMGIVAKAVFLAQFFNTGIIILIINANLAEHEPREQFKMKQVFAFFRGPFSDYMPQWYLDVGMKIIITYFVQGLLPFILLVKVVVVSELKFRLDTRCTKDPYVTKKSTMQNYKAIYFGEDWPIHFRYSEALNITFLAMLYGIGMPIMFPMAALILFN